jgi:hypothetical protein
MVRYMPTSAAALCALWAAAPPSSAADDLAKQIINTPAPAAFSVIGGTPDLKKDPKVQGGQFLRVNVPQKGVNPWDISVSIPITQPIKAGDRLLMAFSARLVEGENGAPTTTLPYNAVQQAGPPYGPVFFFSADIGKDWAQYHGQGVAAQDYKAGEVAATIQLATAKQIVDLGPVFVLDLGPATPGK